MPIKEMISLECPYCQNELYQPLSWFKELNFSCNFCGKALTSSDFSKTIGALEEMMDTCHAEMINGVEEKVLTACCGGKGQCSVGGGH